MLADAGYGASAAFRHALDARGLRWAVGIPRNQKVYGADVRLVAPGGRVRKPLPDQEPRAAEAVLAEQPSRRVIWRQGTKGALSARFAALRVRVAEGAVWGNNRHLPGEEAWLVGEWRSTGERKFYLANLAPRMSLRALAAAIKARWVCEQAHQHLMGELGLGHFEGRSWTGLHRHALMTGIAYTYLQHLRLARQPQTERGKNGANPIPETATTAAAEPASDPPRRHRQAVRAPCAAHPLHALLQIVPVAA